MPKMKTKRAAAKRIKLTATGKAKFKGAGLRHNMTNKSRKRKRNMRAAKMVYSGDMGQVEKYLPYGSR